jgi:hypothetical protein
VLNFKRWTHAILACVLSACALVSTGDAGPIILGRAHGGTSAPNVPAPAQNVSAPTTPVALTAVPSVDHLKFRWWQSTAHHDGSLPASDISYYRVRVDGVIQGSTIAAPAANTLGQPTGHSFGSISPTPTYTRNGVDWTITSSGNGEVEAFRAQNDWAWSTGKVLSADLDTFTSPSSATFPGEYGGAGIVLSEGLTTADEFIALYHTVAAGNKGLYLKYRTASAGAITQSFADGNGSLGAFDLESVGTTINAYYRPDGGVPVLLAAVPFSNFASTGYGGVFLNALSSSAATAGFKEISLRSATPIEYDIDTASAKTLELQAVNTNGISSNWSVAVTATPLTEEAPPSAYMKWYPGNYTRMPALLGINPDAEMQIGYDNIADRAANPYWVGHCVTVPWGQIEVSKGTYDFTKLDAMIAYGHARGLRTIIEIWPMKFGGSKPTSFPQSAGSRHIPDYLFTENSGLYVDIDTANTGYGVRLDWTYTRDRYNLLVDALAARYDTDPDVSGYIVTETANGYPAYSVNANVHNLHDNIENITAHLPTVWQHTPTAVYLNYYPHAGDTTFHNGDVAALREFGVMAASKVGWGTPDMYSAQPGKRYRDQGSRIFQGSWGVALQDPAHPEYGVNNYGTHVYIDELPSMVSWQACCNYAPEDVYDLYMGTLKNKFAIWSVNSTEANVSNDAPADRKYKFVWGVTGGVRQYVNSRGPLSSACPSSYGGTCVTH